MTKLDYNPYIPLSFITRNKHLDLQDVSLKLSLLFSENLKQELGTLQKKAYLYSG